MASYYGIQDASPYSSFQSHDDAEHTRESMDIGRNSRNSSMGNLSR